MVAGSNPAGVAIGRAAASISFQGGQSDLIARRARSEKFRYKSHATSCSGGCGASICPIVSTVVDAAPWVFPQKCCRTGGAPCSFRGRDPDLVATDANQMFNLTKRIHLETKVSLTIEAFCAAARAAGVPNASRRHRTRTPGELSASKFDLGADDDSDKFRKKSDCA